MISAVLDANVYVSAAIARDNRSPSVRLVQAAEDRRIQALICPALLIEVGSVLSRERLRRFLSVEEALHFVDDLSSFTKLVPDPLKPYPTRCRDPDDDYLLVLTLEHGVEVLCTGDRDLLELEASPVPILTPRALSDRLEADG